ncbi:MAG: sigma-70 family RNA polymerase sigma factor [Planctomycetota bacterium]
MNQLPQTRQSLLIRLRDRSDDAWSEFVDVYERAIIGYACRRGLQEADARDVAQEVFAAVSRKLPTWDSDSNRGSFRGWLFRVTRNIAIDRIDQLARGPIDGGGSHAARMLDAEPETDPSDGRAFQLEVRRKIFQWAAEQIRPEVQETSWRAFYLTSVDGMKPSEVAEQLGVSAGAVYAAKFRITARLRELVSRFDHPDDPDEIFPSAQNFTEKPQ